MLQPLPVNHMSHKVLQAQALQAGKQIEPGIGDKAVVVDTVVLAEQQGTCAVLVPAVGALQGQAWVLAYWAFLGCQLELTRQGPESWRYWRRRSIAA